MFTNTLTQSNGFGAALRFEALSQICSRYFDVFSTVHHSIDLFHLPTLTQNSFIH